MLLVAVVLAAAALSSSYSIWYYSGGVGGGVGDRRRYSSSFSASSTTSTTGRTKRKRRYGGDDDDEDLRSLLEEMLPPLEERYEGDAEKSSNNDDGLVVVDDSGKENRHRLSLDDLIDLKDDAVFQEYYYSARLGRRRRRRRDESRDGDGDGDVSVDVVGRNRSGGGVDASSSSSSSLAAAARRRLPLLRLLRDSHVGPIEWDVLQALPTAKEVSDLYYYSSDSDSNEDDSAENNHAAAAAAANTGNDSDVDFGDDDDDYDFGNVVIGGLETCEDYKARVPPDRRFLGTAGQMNSGTTALAAYLKRNFVMAGTEGGGEQSSTDLADAAEISRRRRRASSRGVLPGVPWMKHGWASLRDDTDRFKFFAGSVEDVFPVVIIRDPYVWMRSMCESPYNLQWNRTTTAAVTNVIANNVTATGDDRRGGEGRCPNLVIDDKYDRSGDGSSSSASAVEESDGVPVHIHWPNAADRSWRSMSHMWSEWYREYLDADFPRLLVRFEDLLFNPSEVMRQIQQCVDAEWKSRDDDGNGVVQLVTESVKNTTYFRKYKEQSGLVSGMIKYGRDEGRRTRTMSAEDIEYAKRTYRERRIWRNSIICLFFLGHPAVLPCLLTFAVVVFSPVLFRCNLMRFGYRVPKFGGDGEVPLQASAAEWKRVVGLVVTDTILCCSVLWYWLHSIVSSEVRVPPDFRSRSTFCRCGVGHDLYGLAKSYNTYPTVLHSWLLSLAILQDPSRPSN